MHGPKKRIVSHQKWNAIGNSEASHGDEDVIIEAVKIVKANATAKFDETIELAINLGVDPRHADQMVRGVVAMPNGTGKSMRVAVFAKDAKADEAQRKVAEARQRQLEEKQRMRKEIEEGKKSSAQVAMLDSRVSAMLARLRSELGEAESQIGEAFHSIISKYRYN